MTSQSKMDVFKEVYSRAQSNNYPVIRSFWYFFKYVKFGKYSPTEIFMTDLLDPAITEKESRGLISAESFQEYQLSVNLKSHLHLTEDKVKFHDFCVENNLPVPETVASIDTRKGSFWKKDEPIATEQDLIEGLANYPFDLICKPTQGAHGSEVTNLGYINGKHILVDRPDTTLNDFLKALFADKKAAYIIQRKLYCHQDIAEFTGNPILQTLRIETYLDEDNQPQIIDRCIKLPEKGSIVDNFIYGTSQNRIASVDKKGVVIETYANCPEKKIVVKLDYLLNAAGEHDQLQLPFWQETEELVLRAQKLFAPLKTIGWDVGITNDGPILIEGNAFWDPYTRQDTEPERHFKALGVPTEQVFGINRYKKPSND